MKAINTIGLLILLLPGLAFASSHSEQVPVEATAALSEEEAYWEWVNEFWNSLERQTGRVEIKQAGAVLNVPESFYYLNSADAERVLVEVWNNPPGQNTLGMLLPAGLTPFDADAWAVTIEYEEEGYVSDEDADEIDYADLLKQMQADTAEANEERTKQGYETIRLVGWAAPPYYDASRQKLHWAQEYKFGEAEANTLNYNIRVLGRNGVLLLTFIADMEQKPTIDANIDAVLALAEFEQGSRYSDFDPDIDTVAAYGLGALVAGKVIAKTGLLAAALIFLKKFGIIIVVAAGLFLKRLFTRKKASSAAPTDR